MLIRQYNDPWFSWLYKFLNKNLFGLSVRNHPKVKEFINQEYQIGMPKFENLIYTKCRINQFFLILLKNFKCPNIYLTRILKLI